MTTKDLSKKDRRQTTARQKLIIFFSEPQAWTAGQLIKKIPNVDRATIFRNLTALQKTKVIVPLNSHHGEIIFELAGRAHHAHQFCPTCQKVECVPCPIKSLKNHNLEFFNQCKICAK